MNGSYNIYKIDKVYSIWKLNPEQKLWGNKFWNVHNHDFTGGPKGIKQWEKFRRRRIDLDGLEFLFILHDNTILTGYKAWPATKHDRLQNLTGYELDRL